MNDLSLKATRGMLWSLVENLSLQAAQFLISIVLARLLLPDQFGLIGMLALFIAVAQSLLDSGFGTALIQKKDASQLDSCSIFYFNLFLGVTLTGMLFGISPLISRFYQQPILTPLTRFLSLNIFINAFGLVPTALLTRRMDFKALLKVSLIAVFISGAAGVGLAMEGFGVWSLAAQSVLNSMIRVLLLWQASRWRPAPLFSLASLATMFSFGSRMMLSGLIETFFQNIYQPLIGKVYSPAGVGYYVRAKTLQTAAIQPAGSALQRVIVPALSPIQDDPARLKQAVRKILTTTVFFHFPLMIGLLVAAPALITLLLTDRWAPSIPYFRLFCTAGMLYPLHVINLSLLVVTGRSNLFFRLELIKKLMVIATIAITIRWGITGLLWGQIVTSFAAYFLNSFYTGRLIGYSIVQQVRDGLPFLLMSLLMGAGMALTGAAIEAMPLKLLAQSFVGMSTYLALNYIMHRSLLSEVAYLTRQVIRLPAVS